MDSFLPGPPVHAWQVLHPPVQPHDSGWLDVGDGHRIFWETSGHPCAPAALFVHGGPGAGCRADDRRWFDPLRWRIVLFDQRGAGRSLPQGGLQANDTPHLIADMERLRLHLGIANWMIFGGSWGATLALAYAQCHPQHVSALVLRGVFTATATEAAWLYGAGGAGGAARRLPAAWRALADAANLQPGQDLLAAMQAQLSSADSHSLRAARAWWRWEQDLIDAEGPGLPPAPARPPLDDAAVLASARIGVHYARHGWFLAEGQLLRQAHRIAGVPGFIVQGLRDLVTPPDAAQTLHRAWPLARWRAVAAGHASTDPATALELITATDALHFEMRAHHPEETSHD